MYPQLHWRLHHDQPCGETQTTVQTSNGVGLPVTQTTVQTLTLVAGESGKQGKAAAADTAAQEWSTAGAAGTGAVATTVVTTVATTINGVATTIETSLGVMLWPDTVVGTATSMTAAPVVTAYLLPIVLSNGTTLTTALPLGSISSLVSVGAVYDVNGTLIQATAAGSGDGASAATPTWTITAPPSPSSTRAPGTATASRAMKSSNGGLVVVAGVAGLLLCAFILWIFKLCRRKKRERRQQRVLSVMDTGSDFRYPFSADDRPEAEHPLSAAFCSAHSSASAPSVDYNTATGAIGSHAQFPQQDRGGYREV